MTTLEKLPSTQQDLLPRGTFHGDDRDLIPPGTFHN
jgi:hypothetical protein